MIGGVVIFEARPVYMYLRQQSFGEAYSGWEMGLGFGLAALLCLAATLVPLRIARTRLENVER